MVVSQAKDKEERLLKRQKNRERMEEQHKQRSVRTEDQGISVNVKIRRTMQTVIHKFEQNKTVCVTKKVNNRLGILKLIKFSVSKVSSYFRDCCHLVAVFDIALYEFQKLMSHVRLYTEYLQGIIDTAACCLMFDPCSFLKCIIPVQITKNKRVESALVKSTPKPNRLEKRGKSWRRKWLSTERGS